jgi:hypothetical protein
LFFQVHAYIMAGLRKDMPTVFGKDAKKKELIKNLDTLYQQIQREYQARKCQVSFHLDTFHTIVM